MKSIQKQGGFEGSEPIQLVEDFNGLCIEFFIASECNQENWSLGSAKIDAAPKDHCPALGRKPSECQR